MYRILPIVILLAFFSSSAFSSDRRFPQYEGSNLIFSESYEVGTVSAFWAIETNESDQISWLNPDDSKQRSARRDDYPLSISRTGRASDRSKQFISKVKKCEAAAITRELRSGHDKSCAWQGDL